MADRTSDISWTVVTAASLPGVAVAKTSAVDIWRFDLSGKGANQSGLKKCLGAEEKARAKKYKFKKDRERFIMRRARVRQILAAYQGQAPTDLVYKQDHPDKPIIEGALFSFSTAFTRMTGLLAVGHDHSVGVDLEALEDQPALNLVAKDNFTKTERNSLKDLKGDAWLEVFLRLWTQKEAVLKLLGTGLSMSPLEIEVTRKQPLDEVMVTWTDKARGNDSWQVQDLGVAPGMIGALATREKPSNLRFFDLH